MLRDRRPLFIVNRAMLIAAGVIVLFLAAPHSALAEKGSSHGDRSGGSDDSGSGSHGSDDSGRSGSSSRGDRGRDNDGSREDSSKTRNQESRKSYEGGWRAQIRNGLYEVFDPSGRTVISRKAKRTDYLKF